MDPCIQFVHNCDTLYSNDTMFYAKHSLIDFHYLIQSLHANKHANNKSGNSRHSLFQLHPLLYTTY